MEDRRGPQPGPYPLYKGNHWRSKCPHLQMEGEGAASYGLMGPGLLSLLHFLALMLRSLMVTIMAEKQKIIFQLVELISLSYLSLPVPGPMTRLSFGAHLASP
jgi:hypothetical protein